MGFLDKLVGNVMKQAKEAVSDAVSEAVSDKLKGSFSQNASGYDTYSNQNTYNADEVRADSTKSDSTSRDVDNRSFDEKLSEVLELEGSNYELRKSISPDTLEQEYGRQIYTRGRKYADPDAISYGIYQNGIRVLYIRFWDSYSEYDHIANRQIKKFFKENGIKCLDFFGYLPNEFDYMKDRISNQLV